MSLLDLLNQAGGGQGLSQLAKQLGMDESKMKDLTGMLAPTIGSAAKRKAETGGLESVLGQLMGDKQGGLFDNPSEAAKPDGIAQGMDFLKEIMGGQQQTQQVAQEAANRSGFDLEDIMKVLPALAGMAKGGMQKQMPDNSIQDMLGQMMGQTQQSQQKASGGLGALLGSLLGGKKPQAQQQQGGGLDLSMLTNMLDANGDGSPLDDILGKLMK